MNLSPTQKKLLYIGIPAVAVLGLFMFLKGGSSSSSASGSTGATSTASGSTGNTPIGLDQLTSFETSVTAQLTSLGKAVAKVQAGQTNSPPPPSNSGGYSPPPSSTKTPGLSTGSGGGTTSPTPLPGPTNPYNHITSIGAGSVEAAAGKTIYAEPQPGVYVAAIKNGQWTAAGQAYRRQTSNAGLFLKS